MAVIFLPRPKVKTTAIHGLVAVAVLGLGLGLSGFGSSHIGRGNALAGSSKAACNSLIPPSAKVGRSVPELGSGAKALGWGTAHPQFLSNGGAATGTVTCITWTAWGKANAYGLGRGEIYGPRNTRPIVEVELHAFELGYCQAGRHLAYQRLYLREPSSPKGKLGPWQAWATARHGSTGNICS